MLLLIDIPDSAIVARDNQPGRTRLIVNTESARELRSVWLATIPGNVAGDFEKNSGTGHGAYLSTGRNGAIRVGRYA